MDEDKKQGFISRLGGVWDWWDRGQSLLEQLGLRKVIGAAVINAAWIAAAWFYNNVPWYLAVLLFLCGLAISLNIFHRLQIIRKTATFNPRDYQKFGNDLVALSSEIFRFLADRQRDHAEIHRTSSTGPADINSWQADRDFDQITGRLFFERFGSRVLGSVALLQRIGITMPVHMISTAQYSPNGLPQFLGMMGDLLSRGNVVDAIEISKYRDFMWQIQH